MKRNHLTETPVCPQERLVIISNTTGLSFALERIGPLATFIIIVFYLLVLYLSALSNTPENMFASIYSESLIKTACQHLLLLVGFDTLIYRKYYDTPPIHVGHQLILTCVLYLHAITFICKTYSFYFATYELFGYLSFCPKRFVHFIYCYWMKYFMNYGESAIHIIFVRL
jgi:hypothetical protein